jgi:hypothetical protein
MKKILVSALLLSVLPFVGCNKAEVIPAPDNKADLKIHFQGVINGSDVEWTKNVEGYAADARKWITTYDDPSSGMQMNRLAYVCGMRSDSKYSSISIALGSLQQDATLGTSPNATTFHTFMDAFLAPYAPPSTTVAPPYSDSAIMGFEVRYVDEQNRLFRSDETTPGTVSFSNYVDKEDNSGEYRQFDVTFSCQVKHWGKTVLLPPTDSVLSTAYIQNAVLTGYFKR